MPRIYKPVVGPSDNKAERPTPETKTTKRPAFEKADKKDSDAE